MNGIQGNKAQNIEKPFPGCLGRMVNFLDLGNDATGNWLLTDKPHGSSLSRSHSDVARMLRSPFANQIEDKMIVSELRRSSSNKKASGTPMKTLIAQEMSKEVDSRHNPPNVVAKLMGLDTFPHQQSHSAAERSHLKGYSRHSLRHSGILVECWKQDHGFLDKQMQCEEQNEYRDAYGIWQQSQKINVRDISPHKGRQNESINEKRMTLIRQKFMEAKRLATDEKGRQSKEFQDALEILSSNRDLFIKFLQEPNSMFSRHLHDMQSIPPPPETKRITVLRPSKAIGNEKFAGPEKKCDMQADNPTQTGQATVWDKNNSGCSPTFANQRFEEYAAQPTRIVVLKPSPGKTHDIKAVVSPPTSSPTILQGEEFCDEPEDDEAQESREVAKEITLHMHENLMGHRRDETLLSSVFPNGYIVDDSSFNKSENEYAVGNLSDSEIVSPTSRHSWDYINRFGSPYSSSSFSRASCSPESSVCREAKKRLSERWAMMTSNGSFQEPKNTRRSSSTLGEMLALSDTKKSVRSEEEAAQKKQKPRGSISCLTSNLNKEEGMADSPKSLLRSRSLPVCSTVYGAGPNFEVPDSQAVGTEDSKELRTAKSAKSSLKGKVSSLFFSRNKKSNKEITGVSQSKDEHQSPTPETPGLPIPLPGKIGDDASQCTNNVSLEDCLSPGLHGPSGRITFPDLIDTATKQGFVFQEAPLSVTKPAVPGNMSENQDQPSPISVLEPPFEEDDNTVPEPSGNIRPNCRGAEVSLKSNLIDKSPPIESIARTLSWDDSCVETATPYSLKPSSISSCAEEEQDWPTFIQTLLSAAGLDGNMQLDSFFAKWHSHESPLDPELRNKYANLNDKELLHEAKRRQRRSNGKLVFDCVNAALLEITGCESDRSTGVMQCTGAHNRFVQGTSPMLVEHLWAQMKEWFCGEVRCTFEDSGDSCSVVVERVVRNEVVGKGWSDNMRVELDNLGKEIEDKLLAEIVEDIVADLTS
ncbi:hypothetical protein P3X46_017868 [Hevea brasiliensis]|uniref:DUF4378 domain-containing protein n=1 Tax=Hevea brasiliensis TaxID=3981 RepID=A0ABQ9LQX2_HEVBR|nr:uncharacterized protein LOC110641734 [Hevea brasiliensis]XP_021649253.2 uncharacterized protein LOC110641734 [Hevea brasiliensis]XP_021649254.2 uncharacterized protein LOC110641734 [Hevea brasiliensis]XP_021649255.2 uncharacterized protein LOC110641734 [Hevea brasiliensis]KAJ9169707.1 hypothetical protein P3X46_017868 [Hevea brasiliensis]KAJ9169708.1 hypothetical protein P3X46_017868 [Hevea brasiliensis]